MNKAYINGKIRTMDVDNSVCSAMLVEDGKIKMTGTDQEILDTSPEEVIDLEEKNVLPGFIDTHLHLMDTAIYGLHTIDLYDSRSPQDMIDLSLAYLKEHPVEDGGWISGMGWDQDEFPGQQFPTCDDLDKISAENPIMMTRRCGTICVANSKAMEIAGIDENTPNPQGGEIVKFEDGRPNGVMLESAMSLIGNCVPKITDKDTIKECLEYSINEVLKYGITVAHTEDFASVGDKKAMLDAYLELQEEGRLPIELVLQLRIHTPEQIDDFINLNLKSWEENGRIKTGPIKFLGDGSLGARSAALKEPYSDDPETKGLLIYTSDELTEMAERSLENGFDLTIHAIGDAAVDAFLTACVNNIDRINGNGFRPSIIHSQVMDEGIFDKYKKLDAIALVQPMYIHSDWKIADDRLGKRMETSYCYRKLRDLNIRCAAGSDMPIESVNPMDGIQVNVTREDLNGEPKGGWYPEECLSVEEAIRFHTEYGAYVSKDEDKFGTLEAGKNANFVVLSDDVFNCDKSEIKFIEVEKTFVNGEKVYEKQ